ncbi:TPX2 family protein [Melia azedarach]|uniref:TPX2 family protein n=1 Tax=Melia azedarach TaxID=155640 RepID=A0ACC1X689_MELAZ|nr:TPX2 family protein [Melia azedarach]
MYMEKANTKSALKFVKASSQSAAASWTSSANKGMQARDQIKDRICGEKYNKATSPKPLAKENTKPQQFTLHTQQRAAKRALFNYSVATKLYLEELQRKRIEKLQKMIEEEEIRLMRKEMIPRAQLMPLFDKPFYPQRSNRPLTIPREPSSRMLNGKCWSRISDDVSVSDDEIYSLDQTHGWEAHYIK